MLLAEAPMVDPGVVIMILVILGVVAAVAAGVVVTTAVAGYRYGRDPSRSAAGTTWMLGLAIECVMAVPAYASLEPLWIALITVVLGVSVGARWLGLLLSPTRDR